MDFERVVVVIHYLRWIGGVKMKVRDVSIYIAVGNEKDRDIYIEF